MLPKFMDRTREIKFLDEIFNKDKFSLIVIYGRRRVGKTELIKHFVKKRKGYYFLAVDESLGENIKGFKTLFYEITRKEYFKDLATKSFFELFKHFKEETGNRKIVLAIDEFPYLLSLNKGLLSTFQKIVDELLKDTSIKLILSGSSLSVMENDVLGYKSPLYGRNLNSWKLQPFDFEVVAQLADNLEEGIKTYFIYWGIPYYLEFYDKKLSIIENIKTNMLKKGQGLYDEPLVLLRQEFRESRIYKLILKYLSMGYKNLGKLCNATGIEKTNLIKYLSTLEEVGIIKHIVPLGMKRKGIYELTDPFFRFWFKFIYPNRDKLEIGNTQFVVEEIKKDLSRFYGLSFEYFIEDLLNKGAFEETSEFRQFFKWWHKDKEIDIVGTNEEKKKILFCECKWKANVDAEKILEALREKSKSVLWNNDSRKEHYAVFAKSFKKKTKDALCFDLKDLGSILRPSNL